MAGHSKWANIKIRKGAQDVKRGKAFTKLIREITTAARIGGAEPSFNPRLRAAILAARAQNLPKDTMDKAIKRGAGAEEGTDFKEVRFEGYGASGVAIIVDTLTDNNNRTVADVRHIFNKYGGNMGSSGCVSYLFDKKGQILFQDADEEKLMEAALEAGAEDMIANNGECEVLTAPEDFETVRDALAAAGFSNPVSAEVTLRPQNTITLDEKGATSLLKLLDMLEDNDDVQKVYANFDIPDDIMERLGNG
ncbi:MAG: YebC/PmpR family DNA-binding transcriptional regulator [Magnetococcales bacterium]|nr:YebC/PmpR family DNA-binding transcriptional regulator [Magnetococcales bacterium]